MTNQEQKPKSSDQAYLDRLEFNPKLRNTWLNFFVTNFRVVILLIVIVSAAGIYSFLQLPRESNPEVKIPIAVVTTVLPGASPSDVEELVTKKIESGIASLKGVEKITSTSANSISSVTVEFDPREDLDDAIRSVRDKISTVSLTLTDDANDPTVTEISLDDQPILQLALTGPYDGFTLRKYAEELQDELESNPGIREVQISGGDQKEYQVAYLPDKLVLYGISPDQANQVISATNLAIPAGNFTSDKYIYSVRTDSRTFEPSEIESIPVSHTETGSVVFLRDIATVSEHAIKKATASRLSFDNQKPQDAVALYIIKRTGTSVIKTVDEALETTDEVVKSFPAGIKYDVTENLGKFIERDFEQLTHDFLLTLILVFGVLFVIVGLKEAFVAGLAIPLVFFVTFAVLKYLGMTLNFLSLFSLILALGLLVDDAIVVVSATKQYLKTGKFTPEEAVLLVLNDFKVVLTTTTLTTVWAFLPLLFSSGIIGEFIKSIPVTVSITLIASLFVALMINHPLAAVLERIRLTKRIFYLVEIILIVLGAVFAMSGSAVGYALAGICLVLIVLMARWYERGGKEQMVKNAELVDKEWRDDNLIKEKLRNQGNHDDTSLTSRLMHGILRFDRILPVYDKYLHKVLSTRRRRLTTLAITFVLFIVAVMLPATGIVKTEFFPQSDEDYVYIDVRAPVGVKLDETDKVVRKVEEKLLTYPDIENFSTAVGRPSPIMQGTRSAENVASISITLKGDRSMKSYDFADKLRSDLSEIREGSISVSSLSGGPPAGAAFEAKVAGDDLNELGKITQELKNKLATVPGAINIDTSLKPTAPEYTFKLDPVKLEQNSLNAAYVGSFLRMAISGTEVSTVLENNKEVKIIARLDQERIPTLDSLQNLQMLNLRKQPVFLRDIATIELRPSVDSILRVDQNRVVTLTAGADSTTNSTQLLAGFQEKIGDYQMPSGYEISYGGENEQNQESVLSIIRAMFIAIFLIVATLIVQFNSFRKAFIVLVTIPLALIGVFFGMALLQVPLSFPGLIGVLALFGIVVKNAIILVDKINLNIKSGIPFEDAIFDAGKSRLEAIFITSICTIFGILPVTLSNETWTSLGSAVIFGLSLSSFLTLFIVPTLFRTLIKETDRI
jgi:hydrophobic/amphiphilic exporter-1 (mainly G- bacteria), HAE1 family